ncbi:MAG: 50S ribosomal protein L34e [Candidatus Nanoarchaeia archaeon]|nr:50S ribosomal protein L34e [Candidatus Nanoarchaeia archaeon]
MTFKKPKSRKTREVRKRNPSGKTTVRYVRIRTGKAKCAECGAELHGISMKIKAKSKRKSNRLYGGNLCSACSRKKIIEKIKA